MRKIIIPLVFFLLFNCNTIPDEFYKEPNYITNAKGKTKAYYNSYDKSLALWEVDYEEVYIPTTYGIAHVIISGSSFNEPLVLLHGMEASSTMWYPNAKALSKNYQLFAIDLLFEPGKSKKQKELDNIDLLFQWYEEVLQQLNLKKFHLAGASRGGWIATNLAIRNPSTIKSLTLLSPAQTFIWIPPSQDILTNIINAFSSDRAKMRRALKTMTVNIDNINEVYLNQYFLGKALEIDNQFVSAMQPFSKEELNKLSMPVLILVGDQDIINNEKSISYALENIPNAEGEIISPSGHFVSIDKKEVVNNKMKAFLNKN
ncbi:alpha/beta fold hydrolase [Mangrovimonas spongiae]|uniref:Alpha/beta hydrolase n=1 Tax=Mangrovimonas spongiae TaxID=2494697 RepID=A0A428JX00_9FLAO|nr:alpha/beta hydrolase [Mangrovimonas spongiae]RSK38638.1 alpha/beta hydrolase [Mangrovimonas spongiae]